MEAIVELPDERVVVGQNLQVRGRLRHERGRLTHQGGDRSGDEPGDRGQRAHTHGGDRRPARHPEPVHP